MNWNKIKFVSKGLQAILKAFRHVYCAKYYLLAALRISSLVSKTCFSRP